MMMLLLVLVLSNRSVSYIVLHCMLCTALQRQCYGGQLLVDKPHIEEAVLDYKFHSNEREEPQASKANDFHMILI